MAEEPSGSDRSDDVSRERPLRPRVVEDEVAALMCREGRRTVDRLNRGLSDVDTKASKLMRTNLVLVGLLLSAFSLAFDSSAIDVAPFLNPFSVAGTLALVGSTVAAGITYTSTETRVGISPTTIRQLGRAEVDVKDVEWGVARAYARWIAINRRANVRNGFAATVTILLTLGAVILIATGAVVGAYDGFFTGRLRAITWLSVVVTLFAIGWLSDVHEDFRRWQSYHRHEETRESSAPVDRARVPPGIPVNRIDDQKYNRDSEE